MNQLSGSARHRVDHPRHPSQCRRRSSSDPARLGDVTELIVALIFGVVNVVIRPIIVLLSLPLEIITLGLFIFVINAFMLLLTSWIAQGMGVGFRVGGFLPALVAALIITIVSFVLSRVLTKTL